MLTASMSFSFFVFHETKIAKALLGAWASRPGAASLRFLKGAGLDVANA